MHSGLGERLPKEEELRRLRGEQEEIVVSGSFINERKPSDVLWMDMPQTDYDTALDLQRRIVRAKVEKRFTTDIILALEHLPVFTIGRRGGLDSLRVPIDFLDQKGIKVVHAERGGDITYHGPGQLVIYPLVDLKVLSRKIVDYVGALEEIMVRVAAWFGVDAAGNRKNRGAWVGNKKLGSLGISVRGGVAFHGLAINVHPALEPFSWIHPCGLEGVEMTTLEREAGRPLSLDDVRLASRVAFEIVFNFDLRRANDSKAELKMMGI